MPEVISEEVELLKKAGIDDELVFETGDWVADHDLSLPGSLSLWWQNQLEEKTYKLIFARTGD